MVWPALATSSRASSSMAPSTLSAKRRSSRPLSPGATRRQAGAAAAARAIASSVSSRLSEGTVVIASSVAGLSTVCPPAPTATASHPFEAAVALPVGDGGGEGLQLHPRHVDVVVDDVVAEGGAGDAALGEAARRLGERARDALVAGGVGVARAGRTELELVLHPMQPAGDDGGEHEVGIDVAPGDPGLDAQRAALADHAKGTGAVVPGPGERRRGEGALDESLVAVDVRREQQRQLAERGDQAGEE